MVRHTFPLAGVMLVVVSFGFVRAEHANPPGSKTFSCSSGTACVEGDSTGSKTWGVYGAASSADGVHATTGTTIDNSAVAGISKSSSGSGHGVYGRSSNGAGVYGTSSAKNGNGVEGHVTYPFGGYGIAGYQNCYSCGGSAGVYGNGIDGAIGEGSGVGASAGVEAVSDYSGADIFVATLHGTSTPPMCVIDGGANLTCSGDIVGGPAGLHASRINDAGRRVVTYAKESASAAIEDSGTGRLYRGVANVQIRLDFVSVTDHKWYYVFLTPLGETRGLYVSMKTASAFQVREVENGRNSLAFDYRIVAHPFGARNDRLPQQ